VQQPGKRFAEQLNKNLDDLDMPIPIRERAGLLSKMLDIPKQLAWNLLEGNVIPDENLLQRIATELEIESSMLFEPEENKK
jgi:hypothetical protein